MEGEEESGDRQEEEWGGRGRVGIDRRSGVGWGDNRDRQEEEWVGRGRVGVDRGNNGVGGGEWG